MDPGTERRPCRLWRAIRREEFLPPPAAALEDEHAGCSPRIPRQRGAAAIPAAALPRPCRPAFPRGRKAVAYAGLDSEREAANAGLRMDNLRRGRAKASRGSCRRPNLGSGWPTANLKSSRRSLLEFRG